MQSYSQEQIDRFWSHVDKSGGEDACWLWTLSTNDKGYGQVCFKHLPKRTVLTHRFSYELIAGPIPDGMCVLHRCDNPPCVNPKHLWLGTKLENNEDAKRKGRCRTAFPPGSSFKRKPAQRAWRRTVPLSDEDVIAIRRAVQGGESYRAIGDQFGIGDGYVVQIAQGKRHRSVPLEVPFSHRAQKTLHGEDHPMSRLTKERASAIRREHSAGRSMYSLAKEHGVSERTIYRVVKRLSWRHVV